MSLVSIITPLYNSGPFVSETIKSVLSQTYKNWEMLIVDDCSTDEGPSIAADYALQDSRIKLISLKNNSGAAVSRNTAIEAAQGDYIAFLDSDDLWVPEKLETQISFMEKHGYDFTFTRYQWMEESGKLLQRFISVPEKLTYKMNLLFNRVGCLTVVYNAKKIGKQYMPLIRKRQDYGLWLKILKEHTGYGLNKCLAKYRLRTNSVSSNKLNLIKYQWQLYRKVEKLSLPEAYFYLSLAIGTKILKIK